MARYFTQGTVTTETNRAESIRKAMVTGLTAAIAAGKSTWAIVDDGYINSTFERSVFTNSSGTGFAIMIGNHSTSTIDHTFNSYIGKDYDLGTHTLNKVGFCSTSSTFTAGADGYGTTNYNATTVQTATTPNNHYSYNYINVPSGISTWFMVVEDNYMVFSVKDGTAGIGTTWYFGAFTSDVTNTSLTDSAPYCLIQNGVSGTVVRSFILLHSLNNGSKNINHGPTSVSADTTNEIGRPATATFYDIYKSGTKSVMSKIPLYRENSSIASVSNPNADGHRRGTLTGVLYASATGAAWGDEIDVNGTTYVYAGGIASTVGAAGAATAMAWWVARN